MFSVLDFCCCCIQFDRRLAEVIELARFGCLVMAMQQMRKRDEGIGQTPITFDQTDQTSSKFVEMEVKKMQHSDNDYDANVPAIHAKMLLTGHSKTDSYI